LEAPIGIIDSGVGGLTVAKEVLDRLPNERIIYIGDAARCPYGPRPAEEVRAYTMQMATRLSEMGVKLLVIACNTATAVALEDVQRAFPFPVIGVIEPGARAAIQVSKTKEIAVLGTSGTVNSGAYDDAIHALSKEAKVYSLACPAFVPLVENGLYKSVEAGDVVSKSLLGLAGKVFDTTILGCTHYPLLFDHISNHLPTSVTIISSAIETVHDIERILVKTDSVNSKKSAFPSVFYTTGDIVPFEEIVKDWLSIDTPDVRTINL
jgi:glutamate racemase